MAGTSPRDGALSVLIPRHWAKLEKRVEAAGRPWLLSVWGWSERTLAEAQQLAGDRLALVLQKLARGAELDRYGYGERPMREEIVEALPDAVITRNRYGALVLNTARAMFVDIDLPPERKPSFIRRLWPGCVATHADSAEQRLAGVEQTLRQRDPLFGCRAYRTPAGLRLLMTHRECAPEAPETQALLQAIGCDPLYMRLCQRQACFRARLTPKPWRMGMPAPAASWPHASAGEESRHSAWLRRYEEGRKRYAACSYVGALGSTTVHPTIAPIVQLHDARALQTGAPLA